MHTEMISEEDLRGLRQQLSERDRTIAAQAKRIAELEVKHEVACQTISTMQAQRKEHHKNCVSTKQYMDALEENANEFNAHHKDMLHKIEELTRQNAELKAQLQQARKEENEACAKVCESRKPVSREERPMHWAAYAESWGMRERMATECAAAIRARMK